MTRKVHYLGKPSSGAWEHQPRKTPPPPNRPFLERNSGKLLVMCLSGLIALGSVSWAWSKVNQAIAEHVEIEVQ